MHYADYRAAGYPIGSGTIESAANTVVHHRMRQPGRGWKRDYAQAMLAGLSELHSGRFDRAWQKTLPVVVQSHRHFCGIPTPMFDLTHV